MKSFVVRGNGLTRSIALVVVILSTFIGTTSTWARAESASGVVSTVSVGINPQAIAVDERAGHVFVINQGSNSVSMLDELTGAVLDTVGVGRQPSAAAVDQATGRVFVANQQDGSISILDAGTGVVLNTVAVGTKPNAVAVDETTGRAFVTNSGGSTVSVLDATTGNVLTTVTIGPYPDGVAVDASNGRLFVANQGDGTTAHSGSVSMLDATTGTVLNTVSVYGSTGRPTQIAVDESRGRVLVIDPAGGTWAELSAATGNIIDIQAPSTALRNVLVDQTTGRFFLTDACACIQTFDTITHGEVNTAAVGNDVSALAAANTTGHVFATSSGDNTVSVLDARTGVLLGVVNVGQAPAAVAVDETTQRVFVANSGDNTVSVLDARTQGILRGPWEDVMPTSLWRRNGAAVADPDGRIYALGGTQSNTVEAYSPSTNTWTPVAPMTVGRWYFAATAGSDGRIYAMGNYGSDANSAEVYDPQTNTWTPIAPMSTDRWELAAATGPDGRIYAIGGRDMSGNDLTTAEVYDPHSNKWAAIAPLPNPVDGGAAVTGPDGRIYVVGGDGNQSVLAYQPTSNTWTTLARLPIGDMRWPGVAVGADDRIYVMGSFSISGITNSVEAYDIRTNMWQSVASMPLARWGLAAATGQDGRIYAIGGVGPDGNELNTVEAYGPSINVTPQSGKPGDLVSLTGSHFGANATVSLYWGTPSDGSLLGTGTTDGTGTLTGPLSFSVPSDATSGSHQVTAIDDSLNYPATVTMLVASSTPGGCTGSDCGSGGGTATPELGSGELLTTGMLPIGIALLYRRRARRRAK